MGRVVGREGGWSGGMVSGGRSVCGGGWVSAGGW